MRKWNTFSEITDSNGNTGTARISVWSWYWLNAVNTGAGVVMVIVGALLLTGTLGQLARFGFFVDFGL